MDNDNLQAQRGVTVISGTDPVVVRAHSVQVVNDAVFNTTGTVVAGVTNFAGYVSKTIPAGVILRGRFTVIQLASGVVEAYNIE